MAQKKAFVGTLTNYWGKPLSDLKTKEGFQPVASLKYSGDSEVFANIEEVKAANEYPNDAKVVKFINAQKKAAAKQKAMLAAVTAAGYIQPTTENDEQLRLRETYKLFLANIPAARRESDMAACEAEAREAASKFLGIAWADDDDDE